MIKTQVVLGVTLNKNVTRFLISNSNLEIERNSWSRNGFLKLMLYVRIAATS